MQLQNAFSSQANDELQCQMLPGYSASTMNPNFLKLPNSSLRRAGRFAVNTLTSATVALEQLKATQYDAIVADYAMPDMDGIAFLKALKEMGNTTPVIIFTGRGREEVVIEALNNGADFYLQKGGNPTAQFTELSKMIHYAVSRKRAEKALRDAHANLEMQVHERTIQLAKTNSGLLAEIEERKKTQDKLRETEATIRALMDSPVDAMIILDPDGVIIDTNTDLRDPVGRRIDELIGTNTYDLFSPDLANSRRAQVAEVLRRGVPVRFEDKRDDMWLDQSIHPIFDAEHNVAKIAILARDVTERKLSEEALRESEEKYRTLIETLNEGIWVIDNEAVTTFVNPKMAKILGYNEKEMIGRSLFSFMDDEGRRVAEWNIERRKNGIKEQHDFEFLQKDGTRIYASLEATPLIGKEGVYLGAIAGVADITERKRAEEALRIANKKLNLLSSITRHDINNQLTSLRGYLSLLEKNRPDSPKEEYIRKASKAAQRIFAMIQFTKEYEQIGVQAPVWQDVPHPCGQCCERIHARDRSW